MSTPKRRFNLLSLTRKYCDFDNKSEFIGDNHEFQCNNLASLSATGIRRDMFLEFVLFAPRPDTLSEFEPPPPFLRLISIMYL